MEQEIFYNHLEKISWSHIFAKYMNTNLKKKNLNADSFNINVHSFDIWPAANEAIMSHQLCSYTVSVEKLQVWPEGSVTIKAKLIFYFYDITCKN